MASSVPRVMEVLKLDDVDLADRMRENLPEGTYSTVLVSTETYNFDQSNESPMEKTARVIHLKISKVDSFCNFFSAIFAAFGIEEQLYRTRLQKASLLKELLEHLTENAQEDKQITAAYAQCTDITFIIANDGTDMQLELKRGTFILATYKTARRLHSAATLAMKLLEVVESSKIVRY